ncbi:MAG: D-alanyl-D-alanine carboxypeptidase/D-alanyl-D-alanine-endopeptidase [Microcystaceae cyanobacterium]
MLNRLIPFGQLILGLGWGFSPLETLAQPTVIPQKVAYSKPFCLSRLSRDINRVINQDHLLRSHWGILVQNLETGEILYQLNEDKYFIPASNMKLITSAAALLTLGEDFQIRTSFYAKGVSPKLDRLTVVGRGDPTLKTEDLEQIVQRLKASGVQEIEQLVVNSGYFLKDGINPTWEWDDIKYYYAPTISSLTLNDNMVILRLIPQQIGDSVKIEWSDALAGQEWQVINKTVTAEEGEKNTISLHPQRGTNLLEIRGTLPINEEVDTFWLAVLNPEQYFLAVFKQLLQQEGITVRSDQISRELETEEKEILFINSPKLPELLSKVNQNSDNLYAENLYQIILQESDDESKVLSDIISDSKIMDGSGLSRWNFITPQTLVNLLSSIYKDPNYSTYKDSLTVAGERGTLKNRFVDTPIEGKLWGKTGGLTGVSSLSGYLEVETYSPIVFSIMVNYSDQSSSTLRQEIDQIVLQVSEFGDCIE